MAGVFRFDFYGKDWIVDTRELSLEARGLYIDLLAAIYLNGGPIPYDLEYLRTMSGLKSVRPLKRILGELVEKRKLHIVGDKIVNYRSEEELAGVSLRIQAGQKANRRRNPSHPAASLDEVSGKLGANLEQTFPKLEGGNEQNQDPNAHLFTVTDHRPMNMNSKKGAVDNVDKSKSKANGTPLALQDLTNIRRMFPGYDIGYLERAWLDWNTEKGRDVFQLDNPAGAFVGFCRKHRKENPL